MQTRENLDLPTLARRDHWYSMQYWHYEQSMTLATLQDRPLGMWYSRIRY